MSDEQATDRPRRGRPPKPRPTKIEGADLAADLSKFSKGIESEYFYWVGLVEECPVDVVYCAGVAFPKRTNRVVPELEVPNNYIHEKQAGFVVRMTEHKIRLLRERLPRTLIRVIEREIDTSGYDTETKKVKKRTGKVITIQTDEQIEERIKNNLPAQRYIKDPRDVPAAEFMFAVPCENQDNPRAGIEYPPVLSKAGLTWPEEIEV